MNILLTFTLFLVWVYVFGKIWDAGVCVSSDLISSFLFTLNICWVFICLCVGVLIWS